MAKKICWQPIYHDEKRLNLKKKFKKIKKTLYILNIYIFLNKKDKL